jgi:hypothetical protein
MKKFLFTLVALLTAGSMFAQENYLYVPELELTQEQAAAGVDGQVLFVVAHFDQYVTTVDWTINLPEGVTFVSGNMPNAAKPYIYQYVDVEDDDTGEIVSTLTRQRMNPQLFGEYPHYIFTTSLGALTDLCYSEDGSVCYGAPKWGGDGAEFNFYRMVVNIAPGFTGGNILVHTEPVCTDDPRGNICTGGEWDKECPITVEKPAAEPAPEPTLTWSDESFTMEAACEGHTVVLMINGVEVENPYTVTQTYEDQEITFEAYTVANADESGNSATVRETVIVPAKEKTPSQKPSIVVTPGDNVYTIEATGSGEVELYVDGVKVSNPYEITRPEYGEADITVVAKASNLDSDPDGEIQYEIAWCAEQTVVVPAKDPTYYQTPDPVITVTDDPDNQRVIIKVTGEGTVTMKVTKTADDPGMEGEIVYQGEDNEGQIIYYIPYGDVETYYSVYATACAEGEFVYPADATEPFVVVPAKPAAPEVTATPTVTIDGYTVTATGDGTVYLYVDDEVVATGEGTATYTINPDDYPEGAELGVTARAQEPGKEMSEWAPAQVVYVDAMLTGALNFSEVNQENGQFSVSYNGDEDVTITLNDETITLVRGTSNTYQLPDYGTYEVTATATAAGYRPITKDATLVWTKAEEAPAAPQITIDTTDGAIIVGASDVEGATVVLYQCDDAEGTNPRVIDNPTSFLREDANYTVWVYAVATNNVGETSSTVTEVVIPAKPTPDPETAINEMTAGKAIANVRYFNMAGQEMQEANGMTIVVTTYTDGTTSAVKVMK